VAFLVSVKIVVLLAMREEEGGGHVKSQKWEKMPNCFLQEEIQNISKGFRDFWEHVE
jgi:hypothetical protein